MTKCSVKGCPKKAQHLGYCQPHYQQVSRNGKITSIKIRKIDGTQGCKVKGCPNKHHT